MVYLSLPLFYNKKLLAISLSTLFMKWESDERKDVKFKVSFFFFFLIETKLIEKITLLG